MKALKDLRPEDVIHMDYNTLISLVRETNRPPGGFKTIATIINNAFVKREHKILEIGTSTGVTAIEIAKLCGSKIEAIDINETSLAEAKTRAESEGVGDRIQFRKADAQALPYETGSFDMVFCGNVTSLIPNREKARTEFVRVLKSDGILAAVPMYYINPPSDKLLADVSAAIQTNITIESKDEWVEFYDKSDLVLKFMEDYRFDYISDTTLDRFINLILDRPFLRTELVPETYETVQKKYREYIYLFRDNLSHMGYSILLYKNESVNREPELFHGTIVSSSKR